MIPKIIHFCWHEPDNLPEYARYNLQRFRELNPDYEIMVHGPDCLLEKYAMAAEKVSDFGTLSDLWRYSALQTHGGWYFDLDFLPTRPVRDIVSAYGLDGSKCFVTEQYFNKNPRLTTASGILGVTADHPVWEFVDLGIENAATTNRTVYGPELLTDLVRYRPESFEVGRWQWFYPAPCEGAKAIYKAIRDGDDPRDVLAMAMRHTDGQLPFVVHMWMAGKTAVTATKAQKAEADKPLPKKKKLTVGLVATNQQWKDGSQPFQAVRDGFKALGCRVEVVVPDRWPLFHTKPDVVVMWNGKRSLYDGVTSGAKREGVPMLFMEHGFFDRRAFTQYDHEGFNHTASWRSNLADAAPKDGAERFRSVWGKPVVPMGATDGYVLVLGQVKGDSQLWDSEIDDTRELLAAVKATGADVRYRQHPGDSRAKPDDPCYTDGTTLEQDLAGAAFVVTINSNSITEALCYGKPALALGPSLAIDAGVARQATLATMDDDIAAMRGGWCPSQSSVDNYLHWLACRQWNRREIASGRPLEVLLEGMWL